MVARVHRGREVGEDRDVPEHESDLVRDGLEQRGDLLALREVRRERFLTEDRVPPCRGGANDGEMRGRPRADPDHVARVEQRFEVSHRGGVVVGGEPVRTRRVGIEGCHHSGVDEPAVDEPAHRK